MVSDSSSGASPRGLEEWLARTREASLVLGAVEAIACMIRPLEAKLPPQAILLLQRAEGCLVAARVSAQTGYSEAACTFGRIALEEFRGVLRERAASATPSRGVARHRPDRVSVVLLAPEGPL
jgi:hypothetical protein